MLKDVFKELDQWIDEQNNERMKERMLKIGVCEIKVIGQTALLEAQLSLHVPTTMDVDVLANYEYPIQKKFEELLKSNGRVLDPVGHEAWMPKQTEYKVFSKGNGSTHF